MQKVKNSAIKNLILSSLGLFLISISGLNGQYFQDFDNVQFFGTGKSGIALDLSVNENWKRTSSDVVAVYNGVNGFMRIPSDNAFTTKYFLFNNNDTVTFGFKVSNISGGPSVERILRVSLIDVDNNATLVYTSESISGLSASFNVAEFEVAESGIYSLEFNYSATSANSFHFWNLMICMFPVLQLFYL